MKRMVFFDTETTGTDFSKDRIIEMGYVVFEKNEDGRMKKVKEFDEFIRQPGFKLEEIMTNRTDADGNMKSIADLTHISTEQMMSGINERDLIDVLNYDFFQPDTMIVAYNSNFDLNMVKSLYERYGLDGASKIKSCTQLDLLTVYKDYNAYSGQTNEDGKKLGHTLDAAVIKYKVNHKNTHRAIDDVLATVEVYYNMMREEQVKYFYYYNTFGYNPKYASELQKLDGINYIEQPYNRKKVVQYGALRLYHQQHAKKAD